MMELDSFYDEFFFSLSLEELDYENDDNDLSTNAEDIPQGTMKHEDSGGVSSFMQPDLDSKSSFDDKKLLHQAELEKKLILENKHVLEDKSLVNRQKSINSVFSDSSVKTETERTDSIYSISDNQIIIDARIFLDSYNQSFNPVSSKPNTNDKGQPNFTKHDSITSYNQSQQIDENRKVNSTKFIHKSHSKREKLDHFVIPHVDKKYGSTKKRSTVKTADKKKHISDTRKEKLKKSSTADFDKRKYKEPTKNIAKIGKRRQESLTFLPASTLPPVDPGRKCTPDNTIRKSTGTKREEYFSTAFSKEGKNYEFDKGNTNDKLDIEKKEHFSPVLSNIDKKCDNKADSKIQKSKKFGLSKFTVYSSSDKKNKLKKKKIKIEPDVLFSQKESNNGNTLERIECEKNVGIKINKRNIGIEQPTLSSDKRQVSTEKKSSKAKEPKSNDTTLTPFDFEKEKLPLHKKNNLSVKLESNLKIESALSNNIFNTKLVLERLPGNFVYSTSVRNDRTKPKEEVIDNKPVLRRNLLHLPKARVVLKKLAEEDLRSPASLLRRVKNEIYENVSQKLRIQGKARFKDFIQLYCCKCKSLQIERSGLSKPKNCETCDSQLIYVCVKCSEKHYVTYNHLYRHMKKCRGSGETKPQGLESIVLHRCTQCIFKTTNAKTMTSHMKNKKHKANGDIDVKKMPKSAKVRVKREVSNELPKSPKKSRSRYSKLIVKQNETSVGSVTERYCITCDEPRSSKTRKPKESCNRCKTQLHLRCLKCSVKCHYDTMLKHLRSKCQPNELKCAKCDYTDCTWALIRQHVTVQHDDKLPKTNRKSKSKKRRREVFGCSLCDFCTYYQHNVTRHMKRLHK